MATRPKTTQKQPKQLGANGNLSSNYKRRQRHKWQKERRKTSIKQQDFDTPLNYKRLQRCKGQKKRHEASIKQRQDLDTLLNYKRLQRCKWERRQKYEKKQRQKEHQKTSIEQLKANAVCQNRGCIGTVKKDFRLKKDGTLSGLCQACCDQNLTQEQRNTRQFAHATRPRRSS